ncbi:HD domain-containing protein [Bacteroidota bacterium]
MELKTKEIFEALEFAAYKHRFQKRKNMEQTPYIQHPIQVAKLISVYTNGDISMLLAAILHDTLEDTDTNKEELEEKFGKEVTELVIEVTDKKQQPKLLRKLLQIKNASKKSKQAKILTLADKICNIRDVIDNPPVNWSNNRKLMYLDWTEQVCSRMAGENERLDALFQETLKQAKERLK